MRSRAFGDWLLSFMSLRQQNKWPWQVIPERVPSAIDQFLERTLLNPYLRVQMDGGAIESGIAIGPDRYPIGL